MGWSAKSVLWVFWCSAWAAVWFVLGFWTLGVTWTLTVLSLGAACLPVNAVLAVVPRPRPREAADLRARGVETLQN